MTLADLLAELGKRGPVRLGLDLRVGNAGLAIGDLGGAAIAMVDRDHPLDAVQLDCRSEIVPERLVPILERRRHHPDCRASDHELAELAGQVLLDGVLAHWLLHAGVDAGQYHRLVLPLGCERQVGRERERGNAHRSRVYQLATTEPALQKITAAPTGNVTLNN